MNLISSARARDFSSGGQNSFGLSATHANAAPPDSRIGSVPEVSKCAAIPSSESRRKRGVKSKRHGSPPVITAISAPDFAAASAISAAESRPRAAPFHASRLSHHGHLTLQPKSRTKYARFPEYAPSP